MGNILKNKKVLFAMTLGVLFIITTSVTYAWFNLTVSGNEDAKQMTVETGTLSLVYKDGVEIEGINVSPGWSQTKTFTVTNTGTFEAQYNIIFKDLVNQIQRNELVVSYTCTSYTGYVNESNKGTVSGTCASISNQAVPLSEGALSSVITENINIGVGITHEYTLTLLFKEMNAEQNYNQGKDVNTEINITRYIETYDLNAQLLDNNSNPIASANVEIHSTPKYAQTDENGRFSIKELEVGTHEIIVKDNSNNLIFTDNIKIISGVVTSLQEKNITVNKNNNMVNVKIYQSETNNIGKIELDNNIYTKILIDNPVVKNDSAGLFANVADEISESGLFRTTDLMKTEDTTGDEIGEEVLYFRGIVENNYLVFADYCWRIVRTNESGESIKLRYSGEYDSINNTCPQTGNDIKINNTEYMFNSSYSNSKYVGYVYNTTTSSIAKSTLESWYTKNIEIKGESVTDLIVDEAYCNDTSISSIKGNYIYYGAYKRLHTNKKPSYKCPNQTDKYTVNTIKGNGKLSKPIALLTADEISYAGAVFDSANEKYFLYTSGFFWTMSPYYWTGSIAYNFRISSTGQLYYTDVRYPRSLLPVISISDLAIIAEGGTGEYNNPYIVVTN